MILSDGPYPSSAFSITPQDRGSLDTYVTTSWVGEDISFSSPKSQAKIQWGKRNFTKWEKLHVKVVPENKPVQKTNFPDVILALISEVLY